MRSLKNQMLRGFRSHPSTKLIIVALLVSFLGGCASAPVDVSSGTETATIVGKGMCSLYGVDPYSARAQKLVVDAGLINIVVGCLHFYPLVMDSSSSSSHFGFIADAGHTYNVENNGSDCLQLLDITAGGQIVACAEYVW
jgi:hypothetical protein